MLSNSKLRWLLAVLVATGALIAAHFILRKPQVSVDSSSFRVDPDERLDASRAESLASTEKQSPNRPNQASPAEESGAAEPSARTPASSRSPADSVWLLARWYPSEEDLASAAEKSPQGLPTGDVLRTSADVLEAQRLILDASERERARAALEAAATQGAIYALVALGEAYEPLSAVESQAYFRAAIMLGDWMPALRMKPSLGTLEDGLATLKAVQLLERIDRDRRARGMAPLSREVRPGIDDFVQSVQTAIEQVHEQQ